MFDGGYEHGKLETCKTGHKKKSTLENIDFSFKLGRKYWYSHWQIMEKVMKIAMHEYFAHFKCIIIIFFSFNYLSVLKLIIV